MNYFRTFLFGDQYPWEYKFKKNIPIFKNNDQGSFLKKKKYFKNFQ